MVRRKIEAFAGVKWRTWRRSSRQALPRVAVEQLHPTLARPNLARQTWTLPVSTLLRSRVPVDAF